MFTVHNIQSERKCRRILHEIVFGSPKGCPTCKEILLECSGYCWCTKCRKKVRVKAGTWLRGSRLTARQIFLLVFAWQQRCTPGDTVKLLGLSYPTVARWFGRFREHLPEDGSLLGGIVEMDEAFFGKRKHGHQTIVLGARERKGNIRLRPVPERDEREIELFLMNHVKTYTKLHTDAYSTGIPAHSQAL